MLRCSTPYSRTNIRDQSAEISFENMGHGKNEFPPLKMNRHKKNRTAELTYSD
jgi:hypothetical protein